MTTTLTTALSKALWKPPRATYTGLTDERLDDYPEVIHAFNCLCIDMYDNRSVEIANGRENPTVKQILGGIAVNYL